MSIKPLFLTAVALLAACSQPAADAPSATATNPADTAPAPSPSVYDAAVANSARPEADRERDAGRHPAEMLEFFGIKPGDTVLEMFAGAGYYTELLASVVGPDGLVVAHINDPMLGFVGDEFAARHAGDRLPNVEILKAENNEMVLDANRFDAVTMTLNYHDLYWVSEERGWTKFDVPAFLAELYKGLKPGGVLAIIDHDALPGSPRETGGTLHRIDRAIVVSEVQDAGFVLDGESMVLRNPADDHAKSVFDPAIRGQTDRFALRFRKPQ